jgi:hypothetical protein
MVVYIPTERTFTVNIASLQGSAKARWFNPSNGSRQDEGGGPFTNTGSKQFITPAGIAPRTATKYCRWKPPARTIEQPGTHITRAHPRSRTSPGAQFPDCAIYANCCSSTDSCA